MEEGTSVIRVLPSSENGEGEFYAETAIHRLDDKNYHCPRVKGGECPVCDLYYRLWKVEGPMKDEAQDLARQIKPRKRLLHERSRPPRWWCEDSFDGHEALW